MDVSGSDSKKLDVFYSELRRKYPNTFTLATNLGKGGGAVQKLPHLPSLGIVPTSLNHPPNQRWSQDSFLSKVELQKTQNEQRQGAENSQQSGRSVIIQDKIISVPTWNRSNDLGAQKWVPFHLPTLRTQVEQNKTELKNRLNLSKKVDGEKYSSQNNSVDDAAVASSNKSVSSQDPLAVIVKEILPNKPSKLMTDPSKNTDNLSSNGGWNSDRNSGVPVCTPIKILRPKINNHHDPHLRDIRQKLSAKPKTTSGPIKGDHMVLPDNLTQIVNIGKSPVTLNSKKSSINFNEKIPHRPPKNRVCFEDESEEDAKSRYQEIRLLERTYATKTITNISSGSQIKSLEWNGNRESRETSPSPSIGEKPPTANQQTVTVPYSRQSFSPDVAKTVFIDIPSSFLPGRCAVHTRIYPAMRHITNKPISPRNDKEASSLDGITISCTNNSQKWLKDSQIISGREEENKSNRSLSSLETIESGTTEVSSEVTIPTMGSGGSLPSIGSEHPSKSSIQNCSLELDHPSLAKGTNISFYSKLKRGLHVKRSTDTRQEKAVVHGKSSPWRTTSPSPSSQTVTNESVPCHIGKNRVKMNATPSVESENTIPVKAPLLSMRMMQSLLKKNRPKNYVVSVPSPTQQESRPQSGFKREQVSEQASARLLTARPGSSRGLYLTKRN